MGNSAKRQLRTASCSLSAKYPHRQMNLLRSDWMVYVVPKRHPRLLKAWGITHFNSKAICVTNHLSEGNYEWTFTHELIHAFMDELGYHELLLRKIGKKKNEELVDGLAKAFYPLIKKSVFKIQNYRVKGREKE